MSSILSRRHLINAGGGLLAGAALVSAPAAIAAASESERAARAWYGLWSSQREWAPYGALLAEDFAFSSPNGEDHISKAAYRDNCWAPNVNLTKSLDVEALIANGDEIAVKYLGHTTSGKLFRNVELLRMRGGQIVSMECYFGGKANFPAAIDSHGR